MVVQRHPLAAIAVYTGGKEPCCEQLIQHWKERWFL